MNAATSALCLLLGLVGTAGPVLASGRLDPDFGSGGIAFIALPEPEGTFRNVLLSGMIDRDGRYVSIGIRAVPMQQQQLAFVTRNQPDGSPDPGFADAGVLILQAPDPIYDILLHRVLDTADGHLLLGGEIRNRQTHLGRPLLCRLQPDGSPDAGFGNADTGMPGCLSFGTDGESVFGVRDVQLHGGNERILVLIGTRILIRLHQDGSPDECFGDASCTDGGEIWTTPLIHGKRLLIDAQQRIILAGEQTGPDVSRIALARFSPEGAMELDFGGGDGVAAIDFAELFGTPQYTRMSAVQVLGDGTIVVAGELSFPTTQVIGLAKLRWDGTPDESFGAVAGQIVHVFDAAPRHVATALGIQTDGKILIGGYTQDAELQEGDCALLRTDAQGQTPDTQFGFKPYGAVTVRGLAGMESHCSLRTFFPDGRRISAFASSSNETTSRPTLLVFDQDDLFGDSFDTTLID